MVERNYFRTQKDGDVTTYFYNGQKVTKEKFDEERAASKQRQTDLLGISKEDFLKETPAQRKKRMFEKLKGNAKGGIVKRFKGGLMVKPKAAKRGY